MSGDHNLRLTLEQTIVGRHGDLADKVQAHQEWAIPLPVGIDPAKVDRRIPQGGKFLWRRSQESEARSQ